MEGHNWTHCAPFGRQVIRNGRIIYQAGSEADAEVVAGLIEAVAGEVVAEEREACATLVDWNDPNRTGDPFDYEEVVEIRESLARKIRGRGTGQFVF